jgi:putative membrane protein
MTKSCFVGIALVAMLGAACTNAADRGGSAQGEGGGLSGAANPPSATMDETRLTDADQNFVQQAAQSNQMEVEMARMGQEKAENDQVKEFARQLEQDHSEALDDLRRVANRANVVLRQQDDAQRASMTDKMGAATGREFDRHFIREMIDKHRQGIADFERQQNTATGELKQFIDKTLPVMREHLQKAETLQTQLDNTTNPNNP